MAMIRLQEALLRMLHLILLLYIWNVSFAIAKSVYITNVVKENGGGDRLESNVGKNLNQYVDQICKNIKKQINDDGITIKLPFSFQKFSTNDTYTILFSPEVVLRLLNGKISNITSFQTNGDANIKYINKVLTLSSGIKLDSVIFEYDAEMQLSGFGVSKHIYRILNGFTANLTLSIDATTLNLFLDELNVFSGTTDRLNNTSEDFGDQILYYADFYMENHFNNALTKVIKTSISENFNKINKL